MKSYYQLVAVLIACFVLSLSLFACSDDPEGENTEIPVALKQGNTETTMAAAPPVKPMKSTLVTIGTGGITGVYYPTGGGIANIVNKKREVYGLSVTVESTGGSVFNINAVLAGDLEFGIVQSDRQFQAVNGLAEWENGGPRAKLRAVFSLYPETVTLVAGADSGINTIADLKGKTVNIGNPGSGQYQNSIDALEAVGLHLDDINGTNFKATAAPGLLQSGSIDALFYTVGHPSKAIGEVCQGPRKVNIVSITGVDSLFAKYPFYAPSIIPMRYYPDALNSGADVMSFGVKATLITSADIPDDVVYVVTREVFENFDEFKKLHPAFSELTKKSMLRGLSAPIHPGAMRYYREVGLK
ncbi:MULTISPECIES: TAXI family TRAP transporter solute-binding subunit [unclassified Pseudodesulfovibrio]|uniref:TAXI family TRAP transporter solute-binding subunit n=1 Tax=unclassified Pseudodesulfovibrio TaxID=2661612 RepID=UPI000FEBE8CF|nr:MULTISPECIES: TAXI family TRAP transporter solute-binding subunit [unclassified Pseudodesulfovibrio]MCJ2163243.1 TAXI family TRAP transporter solute-binding subunit [Pseudodesulfovibrio sp. S3-i]RWU07310.1 C4-dicarboxylate ABC transporter substrate-binding protein [Pseudodesulfovibrio sp. S3]